MTIRYVCPGSGGKASITSLGNLPTRPEDVSRLEAEGEIRQPPKRQLQMEEEGTKLPNLLHAKLVQEAKHETPDTMHFESPQEAKYQTPRTMHFVSPKEAGPDDADNQSIGKAFGTAARIGSALSRYSPARPAYVGKWGGVAGKGEDEEAPVTSELKDLPIPASFEEQKQARRGTVGGSPFIQRRLDDIKEAFGGDVDRPSTFVNIDTKTGKVIPQEERPDAPLSFRATKISAAPARGSKEDLAGIAATRQRRALETARTGRKFDPETGLPKLTGKPSERKELEAREFAREPEALKRIGEQRAKEVQGRKEDFGLDDAVFLAVDIYFAVAGAGALGAGAKALKSAIGAASSATKRGFVTAARGGSQKLHDFVKTNREAANVFKKVGSVSGVGTPSGGARHAGKLEQFAGQVAGKKFPKTITPSTGRQSSFVGGARSGSKADWSKVDPTTGLPYHRGGGFGTQLRLEHKLQPSSYVELKYAGPPKETSQAITPLSRLVGKKANFKWLEQELGLKTASKLKQNVPLTKNELKLLKRTEAKIHSKLGTRTGTEKVGLGLISPKVNLRDLGTAISTSRHLIEKPSIPSDEPPLQEAIKRLKTTLVPPTKAPPAVTKEPADKKDVKRKFPRIEKPEERVRRREPTRVRRREPTRDRRKISEIPVKRTAAEKREHKRPQLKKPKALEEIYSHIARRRGKEEVLSRKELQKSMSYIKTMGDRVLNKKMALKSAMKRVPWWMEHHLLDYVRNKGFRRKSYHRGRK